MENQQNVFKVKKNWEIKKFSVEHIFGPPLARIEMPQEITQGLTLLTDKVLDGDDYLTHGHQLAGQIYHEPYLSVEMLDIVGAAHFFHSCAVEYVTRVLKPQIKNFEEDYNLEVFFTSVWAVSQYQGEYNPAHIHTDCDISSVCYLKIPEYEKRWDEDRNFKESSGDGQIEFIAKSVPDGLENGTYRHAPKVGDFFLFPSSLLHTVYPFLGKGERRSVAFNMAYQVRDKKNGRVKVGRPDGMVLNPKTGAAEFIPPTKLFE